MQGCREKLRRSDGAYLIPGRCHLILHCRRRNVDSFLCTGSRAQAKMRHGIETRPASQISAAGGYTAHESRTAPRCIPRTLPIDDGASTCRSAYPSGVALAAVVRSTGVGQSALLLLDAIAVLSSEGIDYAVIGAMAASIYGVVRASIDADAVLSLGRQKQ